MREEPGLEGTQLKIRRLKQTQKSKYSNLQETKSPGCKFIIEFLAF